ncbi:hypothetical protein D3C73_913860 [compost metagenome]
MQGPGRLAASEQIEKPWRECIEAGRHGQPRCDHQRQENEDHQQIGQLLQRIIVARFFAFREAKSRVIDNLVGEMRCRQFIPRRQQVTPEVTGEKAIGHVDQAIGHEQPREKEMPAATGGEILIARQCQPGRKAACRRFAIDFGNAQHAGGFDRQAADAGHTLYPITILHRLHGDEGWIVVGAILAPVKSRMRIEDLQPAEQQNRHAQHIQPMRQPHRETVATDESSFSGDRRCGRIHDFPRTPALSSIRNRPRESFSRRGGGDHFIASHFFIMSDFIMASFSMPALCMQSDLVPAIFMLSVFMLSFFIVSIFMVSVFFIASEDWAWAAPATKESPRRMALVVTVKERMVMMLLPFDVLAAFRAEGSHQALSPDREIGNSHHGHVIVMTDRRDFPRFYLWACVTISPLLRMNLRRHDGDERTRA